MARNKDDNYWSWENYFNMDPDDKREWEELHGLDPFSVAMSYDHPDDDYGNCGCCHDDDDDFDEDYEEEEEDE